MEVEKLENDNKDLIGTDDGAEFEIPDLSLIEQYPDMAKESASNARTSAPKKKGTKKSSAEKAQSGTEEKKSSPKKRATKKPAKNTLTESAPVITEVAPKEDDEIRGEALSGAAAEDDTLSKAAAEAAEIAHESRSEAKNEAADAAVDTGDATDEHVETGAPEYEVRAEKVGESEHSGEDAPIEGASDEISAPDTECAALADDSLSDSCGDETEGGDSVESQAKRAEYTFETDELGRRVVPEGFIPDDALYTPTPSTETTEDITVTDLLGDPLDSGDATGEEPSDVSEPIEPEDKPEDNALPKKEGYDPEKPRRIDLIFDFIELLVFTLVAVLFVTSFFVKHAVVDGPSMLGTLKHGDVLIISDVFYEPSPGDVVVFEDYTLEQEVYRKPLVKRVIAVAGQRVMVKRDGIYVGYSEDPSKPLYEPYVYTDDPYYEYDVKNPCDELKSLDTFGRNSEAYWFIVPEGEIFVLGDHRDDSTDSRGIGTIRTDAVLGKVLMRIYPFDKIGAVDRSTFDYED